MHSKIAFVENKDPAAGKFGRKLKPLTWALRLAGIDDFDNEICAIQFALSTLNANAFDVVARFTQTSGIDETQRDSMDLNDFFNGVAGGASGGTNNGTLESQQDIEKAAFTNVRSARDDRPGTMTQDAALFGGRYEFLRTPEHDVDAAKEISPSFRRYVFFGKIDISLYMGEHRDDLLLHSSSFATDGTAELLIGGTKG